MKVIVGMSGGIDSSMAAYLLKTGGYEVEGLSFMLFEARGMEDPSDCCSRAALKDAAGTAAWMGIPHSSLDLRDAFMEKVIKPFVRAYTEGLTPNPCILCNSRIKFPFLLDEARRRGAEFIATGHYAVVERRAEAALLMMSAQRRKDQSYVLYGLREEELHALLLPLGRMTKEEVRQEAGEAGLPLPVRPESQEICFVENRDYGGLIRALAPWAGRPGPIIDPLGRRVGEHRGLYGYTVGQRKGLGIASPVPLYVTGIDAEKNAIRIGGREAAMKRELYVGELNWLLPPGEDFRADVKIRSTMEARPALISKSLEGRVRVAFDEPQFAPSPGQSAVFYRGDTLLGGGVILPSPPPA